MIEFIHTLCDGSAQKSGFPSDHDNICIIIANYKILLKIKNNETFEFVY